MTWRPPARAGGERRRNGHRGPIRNVTRHYRQVSDQHRMERCRQCNLVKSRRSPRAQAHAEGSRGVCRQSASIRPVGGGDMAKNVAAHSSVLGILAALASHSRPVSDGSRADADADADSTESHPSTVPRSPRNSRTKLGNESIFEQHRTIPDTNPASLRIWKAGDHR